MAYGAGRSDTGPAPLLPSHSMTKKKNTDPLANIAGLNPQVIPAQNPVTSNIPVNVAPPYEYPTPSSSQLGQIVQRDSYVLDSGTLTSGSSTSDLSTGLTVSEDGILVSWSIYAMNNGGTLSAQCSLVPKIIRYSAGTPVTVYAFSVGLANTIPVNAHERPYVVVRKNDIIKIGRDTSVSVGDLRMRLVLCIQRFR